MSTSSQRSGWDYATGMAEQWSGSTDYSSTMSFLEQHDPFPAGFEVELTRAGDLAVRMGGDEFLVFLVRSWAGCVWNGGRLCWRTGRKSRPTCWT